MGRFGSKPPPNFMAAMIAPSAYELEMQRYGAFLQGQMPDGIVVRRVVLANSMRLSITLWTVLLHVMSTSVDVTLTEETAPDAPMPIETFVQRANLLVI